MAKQVEVTCQCGKKFLARVADRKRGWAKSCSKACAARRRNARTGQDRGYRRQWPYTDMDDCEDEEYLGHPMESGFFGHGQE